MSIASPTGKRLRQRAILEIVARGPIGSQEELAGRLRERGFEVTQATVSRDVAELRLVKVPRGGRHIYLSPDDLATSPPPSTDADGRLSRLLAEIPMTVGRSGLSLVLRGPAGSAQALAQAIDQSTLQDQEGTLAGDDTILVLFADEARLERWRGRFRRLQELPPSPAPRPAHLDS
jgi:transcriptional regulator of arginine metabolism